MKISIILEILSNFLVKYILHTAYLVSSNTCSSKILIVFIEYFSRKFFLKITSAFLIDDIKFNGIMIIPPSQTFSIRTDKDLDITVTDSIHLWYSQSANLDPGYISVENQGFILKWADSIEFTPSQSVQPIMKFYSVDTNTIYPPVLEFKWDDQSFETGSLSPISTTDLFIGLDSNPGVFYSESINRFRLNVREEFPARTFQTASLYTTNKYLNSGSLYAVKDLDTNEFVIDFDEEFTQISCDATSSFFTVYMNGLEPERYYNILIQTEIQGQTIVMDENYYFKVING